MLDTHARKYIQPFFDGLARLFFKLGVSPDTLTIFAFVLGLLSAVLLLAGYAAAALIILWISGILDVTDGSLARLTRASSKWGAVMDLIFDRTVETAIIIGFAFIDPPTRLPFVFLLSSIIFSFSIFLTVGALVGKKGEKAFYYQAGLAERTETFIFFSLMFVFPYWRIFFIVIFTIMIYITGCQRLYEAYRYFKLNTEDNLHSD